MGFSLSWLAIKGMPSDLVLKELGLSLTGESEEIPESDFNSVEMPDGWFLVLADHADCVAPDNILQSLSASGADIITCSVEEHVMCCSSACWKGGQKIWSITHESSKRRGHLETQGNLPACFGALAAEMKSKQEEADIKKQRVDYIFEVPVELARIVVGYKHDELVPALEGKAFQILAPIQKANVLKPKTKSFFRRLFGP